MIDFSYPSPKTSTKSTPLTPGTVDSAFNLFKLNLISYTVGDIKFVVNMSLEMEYAATFLLSFSLNWKMLALLRCVHKYYDWFTDIW